jgi:hypothetical protein
MRIAWTRSGVNRGGRGWVSPLFWNNRELEAPRQIPINFPRRILPVSGELKQRLHFSL